MGDIMEIDPPLPVSESIHRSGRARRAVWYHAKNSLRSLLEIQVRIRGEGGVISYGGFSEKRSSARFPLFSTPAKRPGRTSGIVDLSLSDSAIISPPCPRSVSRHSPATPLSPCPVDWAGLVDQEVGVRDDHLLYIP